MSEPKTWKWFGSAGHFICASHCRFHMATLAGDWLISTVGELVPDSAVRDILAKSRNIKLTERGDAREYEWIQKNGYEKLGASGTYETLVFRAGIVRCDEKDCNCGIPRPTNYGEVDGRRYDNAGEATSGHMEFCEKWADIPVARYEAELAARQPL